MGKRATIGILGLAALALYRYHWRVIGWLLGLPPVQYPVGVQRDIAVPMPDGVTLMTDHYYPKAAGKFPTLLMRTVYGRGKDAVFPLNIINQMLGQLGAERGYHIVNQTTRGRYDSGGEFEPFVDARADGLATLEWISKQPWFDGSAGMVGASYSGYVQWAVAADAPPYLKALAPFIITSRMYSAIFADGAVTLDTSLRWMRMLELMAMKGRMPEWKIVQGMGAQMSDDLAPAFNHLPLKDADALAVGRPVDYYRDWIERPDGTDSRWTEIDYSDAPAKAEMPVHLIGGWYDLFLRGMLDDYAAMRAAGKQPYLTIGPWSHTSLSGMVAALRESLIWMDAHLKGDKRLLRRKPVRIFVMGTNHWREMDDWPSASHPVRYYLHSRRWLSTDASEKESQPDTYIYDPAHPTPSLGGPLLMQPCGPMDNRPLETRADVLTYSTPALERDVEVIGPVKLEAYVRSSLPYTDFFARLCDMDQHGRSINICDGLFRVEPGKGEPQPDGSLRIDIDLWATAHRFKPNHRIRLQVSSGAHPRWSRNPGSGEPIASATRLLCAQQIVYHDRAHPSALVLPVVK